MRGKKISKKEKSVRYVEENIKEIVGNLRLNTLFVTMWDILQLSILKNQAPHLFS